MSVIYDALKKVEKSKSIDSTVKINKTDKPKLKTYLVYALVICLGFFIASQLFSLFSKPLEKTTLPQVLPKDTAKAAPSKTNPPDSKANLITAPEPKKEPLHPFVLNGIFFSQGEGYALINNQIVKEGDMVDGAKVLKITLEEIALDAEGSMITLYAGR